MMDSEIYSNAIVYGIQSESERNFWTVYFIFVLLSTLIGDTLILYASFHKDALKINPIIVAVMQHIAVSDLIQAVSTALPTMVALKTNSWVLHDSLCYITTYLALAVFNVGIYILALLSLLKYILLKYSTFLGCLTTSKTHLLCNFFWIGSFSFSIFLTVENHQAKSTVADSVYFDYRKYSCTYDYPLLYKIIGMPYGLGAVGVSFLPCLIVIGTTIPTVIYLIKASKTSRRVRGRIPWQGAITVVMTAIVFCLSNLPHFVYLVVMDYKNSPKAELKEPFHVNFFRVTYFLLFINTISNFYIYTLTIRSFRVFLSTKFQTVTSYFVSLWNQRNRESITGKESKSSLITLNDAQMILVLNTALALISSKPTELLLTQISRAMR